VAALAAMAATAVATEVFAGTNGDFSGLVTLMTGWLQGSLGRLIALVGVLVGIGAAVAGQMIAMFTSLAVAAGAFYLPNIVGLIATATL
jgi:conjugal transfer pilus assembly protein TraA